MSYGGVPPLTIRLIDPSHDSNVLGFVLLHINTIGNRVNTSHSFAGLIDIGLVAITNK
jgi:hypothetical protein